MKPENYFYTIGNEHEVCADKHEELFQAIKKYQEDVRENYKAMLALISYFDAINTDKDRDIDSRISVLYEKLQRELKDAVATTDV